jgi:hypothetical protein
MTLPVLAWRDKLTSLLESRLFIQAASGGGKSRAIRQLLEETHGRVQQFVIDPEGEFHTLREKFDYVLVAKSGGDAIANQRHARFMARQFMEVGCSVVFDLSEIRAERREFVRNFLDELMHLPRTLWRPLLVVVDEAHQFAPQDGDSIALDPMADLASQGRKRGFAAVFATTRMSRIHKDAVADLLNRMIGRTGLDVDVKRAASELGFEKARWRELIELNVGEFYCYGPALSRSVQLMKSGPVQTSHPKPGASAAVATPTPDAVKKLLGKLGDLPTVAEEELRSVDDYRKRVTTLERELRAKPAPPTKTIEKPVVDQRAIERAVALAAKPLVAQVAKLQAAAQRSVALLQGVVGEPIAAPLDLPALRPPVIVPPRTTPAPRVRPPAESNGHGERLAPGELAVLTAAASYDGGVGRDQLSVLTGYKRSSRDAYISRLAQRSLVTVDGATIVATDAGIDALGSDFTPLPTGQSLQDYWMNRLSPGEAAILTVLIGAYPDAMERAAIDEHANYKRSSRDAYISRLGARRLVTTSREGVRASDTLFDR